MIPARVLVPLVGSIALVCGGCGGSADPELPAEPTFTVEEGFTALGLDDFETFDSEPTDSPTWRAAGGRLECRGTPRGYLYTKESFGDFTLRLDVRYPKPGQASEPGKSNTGVLLFITGEHRVWPKCLEVQGRYDEMAGIKSNSRDVEVTVRDEPFARAGARLFEDDWNSLEIVVRDGAVTSFLNGTTIAESEPTELREGPFGLQSEGNPVHVRYLRIRRD